MSSSSPLYSGDVLFINFPYIQFNPLLGQIPAADAVLTSIAPGSSTGPPAPVACISPAAPGFSTICGSQVSLDSMLTVQIFSAGPTGSTVPPSQSQLVSLPSPLSSTGTVPPSSTTPIQYQSNVYVVVSDRQGNSGFLAVASNNISNAYLTTPNDTSSNTIWALQYALNNSSTATVNYGDPVILSQGGAQGAYLYYDGTAPSGGNLTVFYYTTIPTTSLDTFFFTRFDQAYGTCSSSQGLGFCPPSTSPSYNNVGCYTTAGCSKPTKKNTMLWIIVAAIVGLILIFVLILILYLIFREDRPARSA